MRELQPGDKVLILRPTAESKLLMQWKGPYHVMERVGPTDYRIRVGDGERIYRINMLKRYYEAFGDGEQSGPPTTEAEDHPRGVNVPETLAAVSYTHLTLPTKRIV